MANKDKREARKERQAEVYGMSDKFLSGGSEKLAIRIPSGMRQFVPEINKTYRLLFVPYVTKNNPAVPKGVLYFERTYYSHPMLGPNRECVFCNAHNFKDRCAACEERQKLFAVPYGEMTMEQKTQAKALKGKQRQVFQVFDMDQTTHGIQILEISNFAFGQHLGQKVNRQPLAEQGKYKTFFNPKDPYYLQVGVSGGQVEGGKAFPVMSDIEFKRLGKPLPEKLLAAAICLDDLILKAKYKDVVALIAPGAAEGEEEDGKEDEETTNLLEEEDGDAEDEEADSEAVEGGEDDGEDGEEEGKGDEESDGGDDDETSGDDEELEESGDESEPEIEVGSRVTFLRKGVRTRGVVLRVDADDAMVVVKLKDGTKVRKALDDLTLVEPIEMPSPKPAPKKPLGKAPAKKPAAKKPKEEEEGDDDFKW